MAHRRRLRGKKLLVIGVSISASSLLGSCAESVVAPRDGSIDASTTFDAGNRRDATVFPDDAPIANLIAPPDDAGDIPDSGVFFPFDGPIANLIAPPDAAEEL